MSRVFGALLFGASLMVLCATGAWVAIGVSMVDRSTFCEAGWPVSLWGMIGGAVALLLGAGRPGHGLLPPCDGALVPGGLGRAGKVSWAG